MKDSHEKNFYLTTTLPYVNAEAHLGHASEFIRADIIARFHRLRGEQVFLNTGTDEHGVKVYRKALEAGKDAQQYVDEYAATFKEIHTLLDISYDSFLRTTEPKHVAAAQEFWKRCNASGDIYKKKYAVKYCAGCELEKTDSELVNGRCSIHPNLEIELIDEENYFFRFSKFQRPLLDFYAANPTFVVPDFRFNEIKAFVARGLEDFSISRLASKMPWGVPVPGDETQVMYVWFDALVCYISAIGWPQDETSFKKWWPVTQYAGKDNLRQQSAMWQAMLLSAGLPLSKQIVIQGFIIGEGGVKMSKSLGNVISPNEIVEGYSADALRYFIAREMSPFEDGEFTHEKFKLGYNSGLANGLGNLFSRVMKMASNAEVKLAAFPDPRLVFEANPAYVEALEHFEIKKAADIAWEHIARADQFIQRTEPFKKIKIDADGAKADLQQLLADLWLISSLLLPFIPKTAGAIQEALKQGAVPAKPLFPRKD